MTNYMKHFRSTVVAAVATCIGVALVPSLWADNWDKKTTLTITEPLQVPSCCTPDQTVTLQPGEYVMVLVDSLADRHIVRIFDKDQKNVITTILAIPNYRLQPTGKTVFQYWEVPAGQPKALRAWFYPGDNFGQEFAYSKQTAAQIAAFVKSPVPAIAAETSAADDLKTVPLVAVDEGGKTTELVATLPDESRKTTELTATLPERSPDPALLPTPQTASAQPQSADRAVDVETPAPVQPATESLPHTASAMPLIGLAGLVSLSLFAALGFRSRRTAKV
jgi:LPXTG-motif cell wall-anchored protein